MSGLYIHIPFCKQACHYCNFHFSTSLKHKSPLLDAIHVEMKQKASDLENEPLNSIYFGGGTPSLLNPQELDRLFKSIQKYFTIEPDVEVTLEANPDDLSKEYLSDLKQSLVNRLSIGIQSFHERDLIYMNRSHNGTQAIQCIEDSLALGFNLSIDLIYATPGMSNEEWLQNLSFVHKYKIPHLSSYSLTVEPKTALDHMIKTGKTSGPNQEQSAEQFQLLMDFAIENNYDHYEISNFALPDFEAKHNSNYWKGISYLGLGPAAHSYNGKKRSWNIANNAKYINQIQEGKSVTESEVLSPKDIFNEYILTGLRTKWGCDLSQIKKMGPNFESHFLTEIQSQIDQHFVTEENGTYQLTQQGKFYADRISAELFI